VPQPKET
jgi:hypothetical protein